MNKHFTLNQKHLLLATFIFSSLIIKAQVVDSSFGVNGLFSSKTSTSTRSNTISICRQTNGKMLALSLHQYDTVFTINRINEFGKVDISFGIKGKITAGNSNNVVSSDFGDITINGQGQIYTGVGINGAPRSLISCFDRNGNKNLSFGNDGSVALPGMSYRALDLQPNGKILVAGFPQGGGVRVTRLNTDGQVDRSYGDSGRFTLPFSGYYEAHNLICLKNGKTLVSFISGFLSNLSTCVLRLKINGTLDSTFGINGIASIPGGDLLKDMIIKSDGKITLLADGFSFIDTVVMKLYQFTENGRADSSFGINGVTSFPGLNLNKGFAVSNVAEVHNKKVIVDGVTGYSLEDTSKFKFVRFNADGKVDSTYGINGIQLADEPGPRMETFCFTKIDNSSFVVGGDINTTKSPYVSNYSITKFTYEDNIAAAKNSAAVFNKPLTFSRVSIYPNPVKNTIYIRNEHSLTFTLNNAEGKRLQTRIINGNGNIDVSRYAPGIYYLTEKETGITHKFLKQ